MKFIQKQKVGSKVTHEKKERKKHMKTVDESSVWD